MKSNKDYQPTLECDTCGYTLFGDMPQIVMTCDDCIQEKDICRAPAGALQISYRKKKGLKT